MKVISTTDGKYTGYELPNGLKPGDIVLLGDFQFEVQFLRHLENGNITVGNPNYQLECEE